MLVGWPPSAGPAIIVMDADLWSVSGQWSEIYPYLFSPNQTLPLCSPLGTIAISRHFAESADFRLHTKPVQAATSSWIQI